MNFYQTLIHWALNWGNGYAEIVRNDLGQPVEMWPIHPSRVTPFFKEDGTLHYRVSTEVTIQGQKFRFVELSAENVYSLAGLGGDGIVGYSVFRLLAQAIGVGLATQNCAASYYGNGTNLSGVLENPNKLTKGAYRRMRSSWDKLHTGGAAKKNKVAILEQGTKFTATSSTAADAQLIDGRKFTVIEVARILRIPPHKIQSTDKMTLNNLESQSREYIDDTLAPWVKRIRNENQRKLIKNPAFFSQHEILLLGLGDSKTTAGVIKTYRNAGILSINESRDIIDQNAIAEPWANEYHMQMNVTTVEAISEKANLKPNGQNVAPKSEPGENDAEGRDLEASMGEAFLEAKEVHLPSFVYAARRIITKESKSIERHLTKNRQNLKGFTGWSEDFFNKQKADIIDVFNPCCQVFLNTFKLEFNSEVLKDFANCYALDGITKSLEIWQKQAKGEDYIENISEDEEKMANTIINLIGSKTKEAENDN